MDTSTSITTSVGAPSADHQNSLTRGAVRPSPAADLPPYWKNLHTQKRERIPERTVPPMVRLPTVTLTVTNM